jgi:hypothetical protein
MLQLWSELDDVGNESEDGMLLPRQPCLRLTLHSRFCPACCIWWWFGLNAVPPTMHLIMMLVTGAASIPTSQIFCPVLAAVE